MLTPYYSTQFKKDLKKSQKRGKEMSKLKEVISLLVNEIPLPPQYKDHPLKGDFSGFHECHIEPNWLLVHKTDGPYIVLDRLGTHSDLF